MKQTFITVQVPSDLKRELQQIAKVKRVSLSNYLRWILADSVQAEKKP